ncbi:MAG: efflux transporter, family, subunit [Rhodocyclaceae bacterium]|nr:efflux transporter, family, subunit [Rhodocyclaceae bacterium]
MAIPAYRIRRWAAAIGSSLALAACSQRDTDAQAKAARAPPAVPVVVRAVAVKTVPLQLSAVGTVQPYVSVAVKARIDGLLETVHFREGDRVREGQLIFSLDARVLQAQVDQARANLAKDWALLGPIDGVAGRVLIQQGNMVKANDTNPLAVINQVSPIYVDFALPEQDLEAVRQAEARRPLGLAAVGGAAADPGWEMEEDQAVPVPPLAGRAPMPATAARAAKRSDRLDGSGTEVALIFPNRPWSSIWPPPGMPAAK